MIEKDKITRNWLRRYTGTDPNSFGQRILLTNFQNYVDKFAEKFGLKAWDEAKKKEDPEAWKEWNEWQDNTFFGKMFKTDKSKTLEEEYGDDEEIKPQFASYILDGTTGPIESKSTTDAFAGETGQLESITHGIISGAIKIPYGFMNLGAMLIDLANKENLSKI